MSLPHALRAAAGVWDPYWADTKLLLLGNGSNGSTTVTDSTGNYTLTAYGNAQISTSTKKYGTGSWSFDGSGDYLFGTMTQLSGADFTVEAWVYLNTANKNAHVFSYGTSEPNRFVIFRDNTTNKWSLGNVNSGSYTITNGTTAANAGAWFHLAYVRSGTTNYLYVNGTQEASNTAANNSGSDIYIAGNFTLPSFDYLDGYIDDFRITKGKARYTSNFTAPTAQLPAR